MHFQNEGRDYSIQKYGNNLVLMCKVCKRKVLVSFETKTPSMRMEVFGRTMPMKYDAQSITRTQPRCAMPQLPRPH